MAVQENISGGEGHFGFQDTLAQETSSLGQSTQPVHSCSRGLSLHLGRHWHRRPSISSSATANSSLQLPSPAEQTLNECLQNEWMNEWLRKEWLQELRAASQQWQFFTPPQRLPHPHAALAEPHLLSGCCQGEKVQRVGDGLDMHGPKHSHGLPHPTRHQRQGTGPS